MTKYIVIAVVAIALIGAGVFYWVQKNDTVTLTGSNQTENGSSDEITTGTVSEILSLGKNVKCDYTNEDTDGKTEGTIYVKNRGEGIRSDFTITKTNDSTLTSHFIVDGTAQYIWSDEEKKGGIKTTIAEEDKANIFSNDNQEGGLSANEKLTCRATNIGKDLLTPPSDVTFTDFSIPDTSAGSTSLTEEQKAALCGACDASTDATTRDQCRVMYSC